MPSHEVYRTPRTRRVLRTIAIKLHMKLGVSYRKFSLFCGCKRECVLHDKMAKYVDIKLVSQVRGSKSSGQQACRERKFQEYARVVAYWKFEHSLAAATERNGVES